MWLAKGIYEPLPAIYMLVGFIAVCLGLLSDNPLVQASVVLPGLVSVIGGLVLLLKRRAYRASRSRSPYDEIN